MENSGEKGHSESEAKSSSTPNRSRRRFWFLIGAVVLGLVVTFSLNLWSQSKAYESTDDAAIDAHIINIGSQVSGEVVQIFVNDNQLVKKGDLLVEIDKRLYELQVNSAQAELERAARQYARDEMLSKNGSVSIEERDLSLAKKIQAEAALKDAQLRLLFTTVRAPDLGRITNRNIEKGTYVEIGQILLSIVPNEVWVTANFKETQITKMQTGQKVDIQIDAFPKRTFKGHVDSFQPGTGSRFSLFPPENASGNFIKIVQRIPVKIVLDEDEFRVTPVLGPGMSVTPRVQIVQPPLNFLMCALIGLLAAVIGLFLALQLTRKPINE